MKYGIVDFHSHILPGIDDGSESLKESIAMLQMEAAQGICHVVATPHFYPRYETPEAFLQKRDRAEAALLAAMKKVPDLPRISVGAEVYYFRGISESDFLPQLTIRGNQCILIEMPPAPWPESIFQELEAIWRDGAAAERSVQPAAAAAGAGSGKCRFLSGEPDQADGHENAPGRSDPASGF